MDNTQLGPQYIGYTINQKDFVPGLDRITEKSFIALAFKPPGTKGYRCALAISAAMSSIPNFFSVSRVGIPLSSVQPRAFQ